MDHEIASSIADTRGDAHSMSSKSDDDTRRKYILPPSRARPGCCKHANWCKLRSNRDDRKCCEHSNMCHNHQGPSRPREIAKREDTRQVIKKVENSTPEKRHPAKKRKGCISKKNREKNEQFHAKKMANHAALSVAYRQMKKQLRKEKKAHKKTKANLRRERSRRRRAEAKSEGRKRLVETSSSSSSNSSDSESDDNMEFLYTPNN